MEIRLIASGEDLNPKDTIVIDTASDKPVLSYNGAALDTSNVARNDHLDYLLKERDWNIGNRLYLGSDGKIKMSLKDHQDSVIPEIQENPKDIDFEEDGNIDIQNDINRLYNRAFRFGDTVYMKLYKIIKNAFTGMSGNSNNIEILEKDYTGIINFNRFLNSDYSLDSENEINYDEIPEEVKSNLLDLLDSYFGSNNKRESLKALLTRPYDSKHIINHNVSPNNFVAKVIIAYTYQDKNTLKSVSEEIVVRPFNVDKNKIYSKHYTKDKRVLSEVCDGVLRLFPMVPEVQECIIQSCILISEEYEKL